VATQPRYLYRLLAFPITPVSGRAKPAGSGAVESGTCEGGFWRVFGRGLGARQAVPTPMPSSREMTFHEAPEARRVATCSGFTPARGRPNRFPFD
jgi:hypothetical protein